MKGYETPKLIVCLLKTEDVITTSSGMNKYDNIGHWNEDWSVLGGEA